MADIMGAFNIATGLQDDPAEVAKDASAQQAQAQERALALQRDIYNYQRNIAQPFYAGSLPAYYSLLSAVTGQPQNYADPNYMQLDSEQLKNLNAAARKANPSLQSDVYDINKQWYRGPNGEITSTPPQMTAPVWSPTETPAFKWQQSQQEKYLGRNLRTLGRQNSTYGMDALAKAGQNLYASEYDKQLGRLADLTNISRGGASTLANAAAGYGSGAGGNLITMGNNAANATLAGGMLKQNSLYNNMNTMGSMGNLGLKLYDYFKGNGGGGGYGSSNYYGETPVDYGGGGVESGSDMYAGDLWA